MITGKYPALRLRRNRKYSWIRRLVQENDLSHNDLILPIFLTDGKNKKIKINSMPGIFRYSVDLIPKIVENAIGNKIPMLAFFPNTDSKKKNNIGAEALNENNLVCAIKNFCYLNHSYQLCSTSFLCQLFCNFEVTLLSVRSIQLYTRSFP